MKRELMTELIAWKDSKFRLPLILKGARQVGKTFLLKEFASQHFSNSHYFNFEEQDELKKIFEGNLDPNTILSNLRIDKASLIKNKELIIFDEIQQCPRALTALKYFAEKIPEVYLCSAGSLLGITLSDESFPVGKVNYLYLTPLKFSEYLNATDKWSYELLEHAKNEKLDNYQHQKLLESFNAYSAIGGLPKAVLITQSLLENKLELYQELENFHDNMIRNYQSDFAKHSGSLNAMHIVSTFQSVPVQLSKSIDGSTRRYRFNESVPKLRGYADLQGPIEWLMKAGLVYKVKILKKAFLPLESYTEENLFKLYLFDTGLMLRMLKIPYDIAIRNDYGMHKGYVMENLILSQMINSDLDQVYCWQEGKSELDFVRLIFNNIIPIEVKSSHRISSKSLASYQTRYSPEISIIFSTNNFEYIQKRKCWQMPIYYAQNLELDQKRIDFK